MSKTSDFSPEVLALHAEALERLERGHLVVIPTETVYGLAADAGSDKAVAAIFALKDRPAFNPLIAHFYDQEQLSAYVHISPLAQRLLDAFTPGPLTLVLDKKAGAPLSELVTAGLSTLAVRLPHHPVARSLLKNLGRPLAAPSANPSQTLSPTQAQHVREAFKEADQVPFILEGGPCQEGLESTILDARHAVPVLLRPGSLPVETIEAVLKLEVQRMGEEVSMQDAPIRSPGQLKRHYAPQTPLHLDITHPSLGDAYLGFGPTSFKGEAFCQLSASRDLQEAGMNFFAMLRHLDSFGKKRLCVAPIPLEGLGLAINDRLKRASTEKDLA